MLELLKQIDQDEYEIFLYVLMGQGEMIKELPANVRLLNQSFSKLSVLTKKGRRRMAGTILLSFLRNGAFGSKLCSMFQSFASMAGNGNIQVSKLLWRVASKGARRFETHFDLAVAWLEGGSAYYVADHVNAYKKAAFIHTDYIRSGYTRVMDQACWEQYEEIFAVSEEVKRRFQAFYPEYKEKVSVFYNVIDPESITQRSKEEGGFSDDYDGARILTVGRLTYEKGHDIAIEAMMLLKNSGYMARWYVLGEGGQRGALERKIESLGLKEDFRLLGTVENPYPYYAQADIYVHTSRVEGRSVAILEAQTLGCAVIASDCCGNKEQIVNGRDGILCALNPHIVADSIERLIKDKEYRKELGRAAKAKKAPKGQLKKLLGLLS